MAARLFGYLFTLHATFYYIFLVGARLLEGSVTRVIITDGSGTPNLPL